MYRKSSAAALAVLGLTDDDFEADQLEIWTENLPTVEVFGALATQWSVGMNGPSGLRYEALPMLFDLYAVAPERRRDVFDGLRIMERAALAEMRKT